LHGGLQLLVIFTRHAIPSFRPADMMVVDTEQVSLYQPPFTQRAVHKPCLPVGIVIFLMPSERGEHHSNVGLKRHVREALYSSKMSQLTQGTVIPQMSDLTYLKTDPGKIGLNDQRSAHAHKVLEEIRFAYKLVRFQPSLA
jgi:hypothetical protein